MGTQIGYRVIGTIKSIKGSCHAGHKVGDSFELSGHSSAGVCGAELKHLIQLKGYSLH